MSDFRFLTKYILPSEKEVANLLYSKNRHQLFPINKSVLEGVEDGIHIPLELHELYISIGYGFFHCQEKGAFNRLMDPESLMMVNLKQDFYKSDPQLKLYDYLYNGEKLLFFEVLEGNYLAIDRKDVNGRNAVYHFENKIAGSLEEFLKVFNDNPKLLD